MQGFKVIENTGNFESLDPSYSNFYTPCECQKTWFSDVFRGNRNVTLDQNKCVNNELKGDLVSLHKIRETEDIFFVVSKDFLNIKVVCFYISIWAGPGEGTISWKKSILGKICVP